MPGAIETRDKNTNLLAILIGEGVMGDGTEVAVNEFADVTPLVGISDGVWQPFPAWDKVKLGLYASASATFLVCTSEAIARPANSYDGYPAFIGESATYPSYATLDSSTGQIVFTGEGEAPCAFKIQSGWYKVKVIANAGVVWAVARGV